MRHILATTLGSSQISWQNNNKIYDFIVATTIVVANMYILATTLKSSQLRWQYNNKIYDFKIATTIVVANRNL
jgi:hypothetical protein